MGFYQGQYLRSLSINYVSNKKDGKITTTEDFLKDLCYYYYFFGWLTRGRLVASLQPQLYQVKMKICYDQVYNNIGVVTAKK